MVSGKAKRSAGAFSVGLSSHTHDRPGAQEVEPPLETPVKAGATMRMLRHVQQCLHDGRARDGAPTLAGGDFWSCRSRDGFLSLTKLFTSCSRACIKANRDLSAL